jgi:hypothetical protein
LIDPGVPRDQRREPGPDQAQIADLLDRLERL